MRPTVLQLLALLALIQPVFSSPQAQDPSAAEDFKKVAKRYYIPTDAGVKGFHCDVAADWKYIANSMGHPVQDGDPLLQAAAHIRLSTDDDFSRGGKLSWQQDDAAMEGAPEEVKARLRAMHEAIEPLWEGFYDTWNSFMAGNAYRVSEGTRVERTAKGFHLARSAEGNSAEANYDGTLLTEVRVAMTGQSAVVRPEFQESARGSVPRVIEVQVTTGDGVVHTMGEIIDYGPVGDGLLPKAVFFGVGMQTKYPFTLSRCQWRR